MLEIDKYIEHMKGFKDKFNNDFEYIKYVYIDLGKRFSFDTSYYFGNSKVKSKLYRRVKNDKVSLNNYFISGIIICKSLCYICEYIFDSLGFKTETLLDYDDGKHTYNLIIINGCVYFFDLQSDLKFIQANFRTRYFLYTNTKTFDITNDTAIDNNIGYIKSEDDQIEDSIKKLKASISYNSSLDDILNTLLTNIFNNLKITGYVERKAIFKKIAFDFLYDTKYKNKYEFCHCYNILTGEYVNLFSINTSNSSIIFYYDNKIYQYVHISEKMLLSLLSSELKIKSGGIFFSKKMITKNNIDAILNKL